MRPTVSTSLLCSRAALRAALGSQTFVHAPGEALEVDEAERVPLPRPYLGTAPDSPARRQRRLLRHLGEILVREHPGHEFPAGRDASQPSTTSSAPGVRIEAATRDVVVRSRESERARSALALPNRLRLGEATVA